MNKHTKPNPELLVKTVLEHKLTVKETAKIFNCSTRWIYTLLNRYKTNGIENLTGAANPTPNPKQHQTSAADQ